MKRMKFYTIYAKPPLDFKRQSPLFVREGFNVAAFFFTLLWALYHRLWKLALLIFAFQMLIELLGHFGTFTFGSLCAMQIAFNLIVAFNANDWRRAALRRRGYHFLDIAAAGDETRAEQRYFDRALPFTPATA